MNKGTPQLITGGRTLKTASIFAVNSANSFLSFSFSRSSYSWAATTLNIRVLNRWLTNHLKSALFWLEISEYKSHNKWEVVRVSSTFEIVFLTEKSSDLFRVTGNKNDNKKGGYFFSYLSSFWGYFDANVSESHEEMKGEIQ